jgi:hypothetical protein
VQRDSRSLEATGSDLDELRRRARPSPPPPVSYPRPSTAAPPPLPPTPPSTPRAPLRQLAAAERQAHRHAALAAEHEALEERLRAWRALFVRELGAAEAEAAEAAEAHGDGAAGVVAARLQQQRAEVEASVRGQAEMQAAAREAAAQLAAAQQAAEEASAAGRAAAERQEELGRNVIELEARCGRLQAERDASRRWLETLEDDKARRDIRTPATPGGGGAAASATPAAAAAAASAAVAASPSRVATLEQRERLGEAARSELEAKAAELEAVARAAKAAQRTAEQEAAHAKRAEAAAAERSASLEALLAASQARRAQLEASSLEGGGGAAGRRDYDARMLVDDQTLGSAPPPAAGHKVLHLAANPARGAKDSTLEALRARLSSLECELEASRLTGGGGGGGEAAGGGGGQAAQAALQTEVGELKAAKASLETQKARRTTAPNPQPTASNHMPATHHAPRATRHVLLAARCSGAAQDHLQRTNLRVPQDRDAPHGLPRGHGGRDAAVRGPPLDGPQGGRAQVPLQQGGRHGAAPH